MIIKRNIIFSLENRKREGNLVVENVPVRMRVIYGGKRIDFSTGYRIDANKWDNAKQKVKNGCTNKLKQSATEINTDLLKYQSDIQQIFKEFEVQETIPSPEQIKSAFNDRLCRNKENSTASNDNLPRQFQKAFNEFVKECGRQNNWTPATYQKFAATKNHLESFNSNLSFENLDDVGLTDYVYFLQNEKKMRNSTIGKQLGYLKWFLRWAAKKDYPVNNAFLNFSPKLKQTQKKVIFLTWAELTKLKEFSIPASQKYLEQVRDVFLFCCFTGLRYSDVYNLKRSDIKKTHIEVTTIKTSDSLIIELNKHSKAILEKYEKFPFKNDKVLPVISNQKMNDYLKELAKLAEIDEPVRETYYKGNERIDQVKSKYELLSTHAARRTFICNALSLGIQPQVVMKWTGHSDYKAMKPYIDIADDIKADAMSKFNQL